MKKLLLILIALPMIGFGQYQYKLDSLTFNYPVFLNFPEITIYEFEYDSQGNTIKMTMPNIGDSTFHIMDSTGTILYSYDKFYTFLQYNSNNQLISYYEALLNTNSQIIETMSNSIFFYDSNNNLISIESERTNLGNSVLEYGIVNLEIGAQNAVDGKSKRTYTYDINSQNILQEYVEEWNGSNYIPISKYEIIWQSGINTSTIFSYYDNNSWEIIEINYHTYILGDISEVEQLTNFDGGVPQDTSTNYYYYNNELMTNTASYLRSPMGTYGFQNLYQIESADIGENQGDVSIKYYYSAFTSTEINEYNKGKKLLKVTDLLGRETKGNKNEVLFYIYNDGTVEKRIVIE